MMDDELKEAIAKLLNRLDEFDGGLSEEIMEAQDELLEAWLKRNTKIG